MSIYDKSSLVLIPSGTKTGKVYSQKPVSGDGDFTFTRSSAATRVNADGNIEKETQNKLTYSNTFDQWSPVAGTLAQGVTDPFGGNTAWSITATNNDPYLYNQTAWSGVVTLSIWAKGVGSSIGKPIQLRMGGSSEEFTLTGDWQRFEKLTNGSASNIGIEVPNPAVAGDVVHIYGAQLEDGLVARDYIETTTTAVEGGITDNVPRLDYTDSSCPALLLEPQRTNVAVNSEHHSGTTYGNNNVTTTDNQAISPEGVQNAAKIVLDNGINHSNGGHSYSFNSTGGTIYTISVFAKAGEYRYFTFTYGSVAAGGGHFDLQEGTLLGTITNSAYSNETASIEDYGNGWYRLVVSLTDNSTTTGRFLSMKPSPSASVPSNNSYTSTGDGTSGAYIYGFQIEASASYATSYIPTYGSSVTRTHEGTFAIGAMQSKGLVSGPFSFMIDFKDIARGAASGNFIYCYTSTGGTMFYVYAGSIGVHTPTGEQYLTFPEADGKFALVYDGTNVKFFKNGAKYASTYIASTRWADMDDLRLYLSGSTAKINYNETLFFNTALTDQEAIDLTTI